MALADYIIQVDREEDEFSIIMPVGDEIRNIVEKCGGIFIKKPNHYKVSVPKMHESKFKDAVSELGKKKGVNVNVKKDTSA